MLESHPAILARQLALYATSEPLPLLDGSRATLDVHAMAFLAQPRLRVSDGRWFRQTPTFEALGPAYPDLADQRVHFLVVHWRRLLAKGLLQHDSTLNVSLTLRRLAHRAWWTLLPMLEEHDVVLARLLTAASRNVRDNPKRAAEDPLWVGFDNNDDATRFDNHATTLLASRRKDAQSRDGFCEKASHWLSAVFKPVTHAPTQRDLGFCTVRQHVRGGTCDACPEIAADRRFLVPLEVPKLLDRSKRQYPIVMEAVAPSRTSSVLGDNLRWILDARSRLDGVYRFTHISGAASRFIDVKRLWARWRALGIASIFDEHCPPIDQLEGPRQAKRFLERALANSTIPEHSYSAQTLFLEAEWGTEDDFQTSYSAFIAVYDNVLLNALKVVDQRSAAMVKARSLLPKTGESKRPPRRVVTRSWAPNNGEPPIPILVIRSMSQAKRTRNFYTLPYDVDSSETDKRSRIGRGIQYDGRFYWTAQAINSFANKVNYEEEPLYPWAREFCEWVGTQEPILDDDKLFNNALYSDRLPQRLQAIAAGEMAHLGMFAQREDDAIIDFFVEKQTKRRLTPLDWEPLLQQLPGRNVRGILKRLEDLGKKYAFEQGYQVYARSPYHRKFAAKRRAQWIKEGCPL